MQLRDGKCGNARGGVTVLGDVGQVGDDLDGLPLVRRCSGCERHGWRVKTEKFLTFNNSDLIFGVVEK